MRHDRLDGLVALRGLAASGIVFVHAVMIGDLPAPGPLRYLAEIMTLAVELFFVTSAFSLCYGYWGKLATGPQLRAYALRRFMRIAPLFYVMIAVWTGYMYVHGGRLSSLGQLLTNVTFTFGLTPATAYSLVPAGWSVGVEMLFYMLLPVLLVVVRTPRAAVAALVGALIVGYGFHLVFERTPSLPPFYDRQNLVTQLPCFLMGILAYMIYVRAVSWSDRRKRWVALSSLCLTPIWIATAALFADEVRALPGGNYIGRYIVVSTYPAIVLAVSLYPAAAIVNRMFLAAGAASYSVYLTHPFTIQALLPVRAELGRLLQPGSWSEALVWLVVSAVPVGSFAALTYWLVERWHFKAGAGRPAAVRQHAAPSYA